MAKQEDLFAPPTEAELKKTDTSKDMFAPPSEEELSTFEKPSQLEAAARGAGQGLTFGFLDELISTLGTKGASPSQIIAEPKKAIETEKQMMKDYESNLKEQRAVDKKLKEAYPATSLTSEIAGGILPALLTGGGTAAGNIAAATTKGGLKQAMEQGAKLGAGYGALSGAGISEADNLGDLATDIVKGGAIGAGSGALLPVAVKGAKEGAKVASEKISPLTDSLKEKITAIPILQEGLEAYSLAKKGQSVIGKSNYNKIIEDSKKLINDELKPLMISEKSKYSNAIGKIIKKVNNISDSADIQKEFSSIEKQIDNLLKQGKVPTQEGKQILSELLDTINIRKTELIKVKPTKEVKSGIEQAIDSLKKTQAKIKANAKETGESVNFTKPKIDLENGTVTVFETSKGKPLTANIKTGEFTPVKFSKEPQYKKYSASMLHDLKKSINELSTKAKDQKIGVASKPLAKMSKITSEKLDDLSSEVGLSEALKTSNKGYSTVTGLDDLLPKSLLKNADKESANKAAQFFRKSEIEGISGDELRDRLQLFYKELKELNPTFADDFMKNSENIAKRYELARTARQSFGTSFTGTGKATSILSGSVLGSTVKGITSPVKKVASKLSTMSNDGIKSLSNSMVNSQNKGVQSLGGRLTEAMAQEGAAKNQAIWALSQNPAFRRLVENHTTQSDEELSQLLEPIQELNMDEIEPIEQPVEREVSSEGTLSDKLGARESSNNYQAKNRLGYLGKYQFGGMALQDLGYKNAEGEWTGKDGINSEEDFLNSPDVQEAAFEKWVPIVKKYNTSKGLDKYIGQDFNGIKITEDGLFAAAHLVGSKSVQKMLESGEVPEDANGVKATEYLEMFANNEAPVETEEVLEGQMSVDPELQQSIENDIDRVNTQQGSGQDIPMSQLDNLMGKINQLNISEEQINELENDAVNMYSFADGQALKEKIRKLQGLS